MCIYEVEQEAKDHKKNNNNNKQDMFLRIRRTY